MRIQLVPPAVGVPVIEWFKRMTAALGIWAAGTRLPSVAVAASETTVPHRLGIKPSGVFLTALGNATVWQTRAPDGDNVYVEASAPIDVDIIVY